MGFWSSYGMVESRQQWVVRNDFTDVTRLSDDTYGDYEEGKEYKIKFEMLR